MAYELLTQVRLIDPVSQTDRVGDVLIEDGWVRAIADQLSDWPTATQVTPAAGCILAPGLVDLYSQSGEPGFEERETLASLRQAAIAGGFTRLTLLPNTTPALDQPSAVTWMQERWRSLQPPGSPPLQLQLWGAYSLGLGGEQLTAVADLAAAGVVGWGDGNARSPLPLIRRLLEYVQPYQRPVMLWARDAAIAGAGSAREGDDAIRLGLPGDPALSETAALARLLECVALTQTPVHLMRLSTARGVALVRSAKAQGYPITASTTWLHVLHNTADLASYNPNLRLTPPLGTPADQQALRAGLLDGTIDAIAVDHAAYTYEEKTVAFGEAPSGAIGLELVLPALWQAWVTTGEVQPLDLWRWLSQQPAHITQRSPARIEVGQPLEAILFDPQPIWTVTADTLQSQAANTHWCGRSLQGQVRRYWMPAL